MHSVWWRGEKHSPNSKGILGRWGEAARQLRLVRGRSGIRPSHIYIFLREALSRGGMLSRYTFMKMTGLSEASARTFMKKMVAMGLAQSMKGGHHLTHTGVELANYLTTFVGEHEIRYKVVEIDLVGWASYIKTGFRRDKLMWLRDQVIRSGGDAALILQVENNNIIFPESGEPLSNYHPELNKELISTPSFKEAKFIVISYARTRTEARLSTLDTALNYLEETGY